MRSTADAPSVFASWIMYSSTVKSFRRQGIFTAAAISFRYCSDPRNHPGSVRTEMADAPAAS